MKGLRSSHTGLEFHTPTHLTTGRVEDRSGTNRGDRLSQPVRSGPDTPFLPTRLGRSRGTRLGSQDFFSLGGFGVYSGLTTQCTLCNSMKPVKHY